AGLGRLVDHLERRGLVQRSPSAINRRYYVLYLTNAGKALLGRMRPAIAESEKILAAKVGPRAYRQLQRALSTFLSEDTGGSAWQFRDEHPTSPLWVKT